MTVIDIGKGIIQNLDEDFVKLLNKVKGKRLMDNGFETSFRELTKELANNPNFLKMVDELTNGKSNININIRMDKKRLW